MATYIFNGECPSSIKQAFIDSYKLVPAYHADTWYKYANDTEWRTVSITGTISRESISNVTNVVALEIGSDVTSIGQEAFSSCSGLTGILVIPDSVTRIGDSAFVSTSNLTKVIFGNGLTSTGYNSFCGSGIQEIDFGNTITTIDNDSFYTCNLISVTIPSRIIEIGSDAFHGCSSLLTANIDSSIIAQQAFLGCENLTTVTIGEHVTSIYEDVFLDCDSVTDVYCYPNPANLTWAEDGKDDFKSDGSTRCHVKAEYLTAYQTKFGDEVNVTFIGDLT